ncbi:Mechanosensitive channel MscK precursor [Planctomycetes bacterium Pan216]|uniref:Mechanosensitive channel MscK n=1 Tax=Kolteria novifilia TaxID=2527975 RepID=A0A518B3E1_9BACT|nr:Mechanosensitive channel MscK precursor [Planctomycetes bacterium Pan216]
MNRQLCRLALLLIAGWIAVGTTTSLHAQESKRSEPTPTSGIPQPDAADDPTADQPAADELPEEEAKKEKEAKEQKPDPGSTPTEPFAPRLTIEMVEKRIKEVEESKELKDEQKKELIDLYQKTVEQLQNCQKESEREAHFLSLMNEASSPEELKKELGQPMPLLEEISPDTSLTELQKRLDKTEKELNAAREMAEQLESEPSRRAVRRLEIPKTLAADAEAMEKARKQLEANADSTEPLEVKKAKQAFFESQLMLLKVRDQSLKCELGTYEHTGELTSLRRDQAVRKVSHLSKEVKLLQEAVLKRRQKEAKKQAAEAKEAARKAMVTDNTELQKLALDNAELAEQRTGEKGLGVAIKKASETEQAIRAKIQTLSGDRGRLVDQVEGAGRLTHAIGLLLRKQRDALPDIGRHLSNLADRRTQITEVMLKLDEFREKRSELATLSPHIQGVLNDLPANMPLTEREEISREARRLLESQRKFLDELIGDYDTYFTTLVELDTAERALVEETQTSDEFISRHILWIRSTAPLGLSDFPDSWDALSWLVSPKSWLHLFHLFANEIRVHAVLAGVAMILFLVLLAVQRRLRVRLKTIGKRVSKSYVDTYSLTGEALVLTALMAVLWPGLMWIVGWTIQNFPDARIFSKTVGESLCMVAFFFLAFELVRQVWRPHGLAEVHFRWRASSVAGVRRSLHWLMVYELPLIFIVSATEVENWSNEDGQQALGRIAFILGLAGISVFMIRNTRPRVGVFAEWVSRYPDGFLARYDKPVRYSLVCLPLVPAVLSVIGYHYTALQLERKLEITIALFLVIALVYALCLRWLLVARGKLARKLAEERRAEEAALAAATGESSDPSVQPQLQQNVIQVTEEREVDLSQVDVQTRQLLRGLTGLAITLAMWGVWMDMLPALGVLDPWSLMATSAEGDNAVELTVGHFILGGLILLMTVIASKNVPGLLEITILKHLPVDAGGRYAITTIVRYVITLVGAILALAVIGIRWSNVQWLAAAVTVGLGFGLQEIFANFVSGLILLLERPIRVGDIVTVDDVSGVVSRIRIRATTITDWDRKEFIVPNKEFITGRLMNWTLTNTINRIVINVGVAYGSDMTLARDTLLKVANDHPSIMDDPKPLATFEGFGDSTLNLVLRCYLKEFDNRLETIHELHRDIDLAYRAANIEIAFPQQDLHIRSFEDSLDIHRGNSGNARPVDGHHRESAASSHPSEN